MTAEWVSVHVFYAGDLDRLLVEAVRPIVADLRSTGAVGRWFFIRYWNGGRHLRVRLEPGSGREDEVVATASEHLEGYVACHPGGREDRADYLRRAEHLRCAFGVAAGNGRTDELEPEPIEPLQPPDSVRVRPYRYEFDRYGGPAARPLTEGHFWRSSELAVTVVSCSLERPGARVSLAFELLALVPGALGVPAAAASELFRQASGMRRYVEPDRGDDHRPDRFAPYEEQRDDVLAVVRRAVEPAAMRPSSLVDVARQLWAEELHVCHATLMGLWGDGQLTCHPHHVMMSYVHMLNNRLGIGFVEECQLYALLAHAMSELDPSRESV